MSGFSPASCWLTHKTVERWTKAAKERALGTRNGSNSSTNSLEDFNVSKEQMNIQPPRASTHSMSTDIIKTPLDLCSSASTSPQSLQHQSRSYPGGPPLLCRTPSASSQSSLDSSTSKQGSHRGSSPQIRTFAPDGKASPSQPPFAHHHEATHTISYPLTPHHHPHYHHRGGGSSRSPSPHRAASLDIRSTSPFGHIIGAGGDVRTPSPSQSSLTSLTGSSCNSPVPASPRNNSFARCLSPLFIPPSRGATPDMTGPPASPLGAIQPDLYVKKDGPLFIGESNKAGGASLGRLHFRLSYDFDRSDFVVHLIEAHDLAGSEQGGFNDPYVRLILTPEVDNRKRQTNIHRNDANPVFNDIFKFPVSHEELKSKSLLLQVFDYDRFSRNDIIGEVTMPLSEYDCANSIEIWGEITKNKKPPEELQEVLVSLMYLPSAERLTVNLVKARNLFIPSEKDFIDPFVKVNLIVNGKRIKKKKSSCKKNNCNPVWNEALIFNLSSSNVQNTELEICIYDQGNDIMGSNPLLGCCTIGPKAPSNSGKEHWTDMLHSPRKTVFSWHTVRTICDSEQTLK
ncbi:synaptotagmin-5 isoform X2 [Anthonomus grandis grandis]|uniref:synaptotagmin-5 isoform X2 n=1 Tax=Anthonomus grandis grandis TaxID=2921223 RepID=UPI0021656D3F|nr:synaptotagmin-5 isoform X2 [Anthonomus grandis grandis]